MKRTQPLRGGLATANPDTKKGLDLDQLPDLAKALALPTTPEAPDKTMTRRQRREVNRELAAAFAD